MTRLALPLLLTLVAMPALAHDYWHGQRRRGALGVPMIAVIGAAAGALIFGLLGVVLWRRSRTRR